MFVLAFAVLKKLLRCGHVLRDRFKRGLSLSFSKYALIVLMASS